ncbi:MAG: PspC domain-containing protein [Treponema sp.]|nr:PspC domain-containing protein [Treponema sp.]
MKKLRKSNKKMLFGVCGGVAEYFKIDPTIVRICVCLVALFKGVGVVLYLIAALVMPESDLASDDDVENMKSANIDSDDARSSDSSSSSSSGQEGKAPHSDDEFNKFFKK